MGPDISQEFYTIVVGVVKQLFFFNNFGMVGGK